MGIKIIDSINFIPINLSKMPKTFGLSELKKEYFPHFFNTPANQNYPAIHLIRNMSVEENVKF
jgi:hypothetical protein